jgi:hypothetical protein
VVQAFVLNKGEAWLADGLEIWNWSDALASHSASDAPPPMPVVAPGKRSRCPCE